jgi:hypothetical protein
VELYSMTANQLCDAEFNGKMFHLSKEKDETGECKYQTLTHSKAGDLYLLKLFNGKIEAVCFKLVNDNFEHSYTKTFIIEKSDWDYLYGSVADGAKTSLIISYGKVTPLDEKEELPLQTKEFVHFEDVHSCMLSAEEHVIVYDI